MTNNKPTEKPQKLVKLIEGLDPEQSKLLSTSFGDLFEKASVLSTLSKEIRVTGADQIEEMEKAKELRKELRDIRLDADKTRKKLKAGYILGAKAIQNIFNDISDITKPAEDYLREQEDFAKRLKQIEYMKIEVERIAKLGVYIADLDGYKLHPVDMSTETFDKMLATSKESFEAKLKVEAMEKQEKEKQEKIDKLTSMRKEELIPIWSFLTPTQKTLEFGLLDEISFRNILLNAKEAKKIYEKTQEQIRLDNEKLKKQAEKKEKALKLQKEKTKKAEAKIKAANDKAKSERKAKEEAERQALLAPDKAKLLTLAASLGHLELPSVKSDNAQKIVNGTRKLLNEVGIYVLNQANKL